MVWKYVYFSSQYRIELAKRNFISPRVHVLLGGWKWYYDQKVTLPLLFTFYKNLSCQNFKPWLWREVRLFELRILDTIARHYSMIKWPSSKERVGSKEAVTSSNQEGSFLESPETFRAHFEWHDSLSIFKPKASRGTKLYSYFNFYSFYNISKDQLYRISGSEFQKWLFGHETLSRLSRNGPQKRSARLIFYPSLVFVFACLRKDAV